MPTLEVEVVDVGAQGLGDAQTVEGQQRRQGVVTGRAEAGLDEEDPQLVAVQSRGPGFVVHLGPAHVEGGVAVDDLLLLAVLVEAGQRG